MIRKLKRKFILIAMLSVIAVLGTIIGVVNIVNYRNIDRDSDKVLALLVRGEGRFPMETNGASAPETRPQGGGIHGLSPETPYETRYFTVTLSDDGTVRADTGRIAAVSEDEAIDIARRLAERGKDAGRYADFKYRAVRTDGSTMFVFLDCGRNLGVFRNFLLYSSLISLGGILLVFVLVIVFSKFAVKPMEESYKKQKSFITNASHDIKTPLTVIGADTEVIELKNGESEWTNDIKKQIERLSALTDKLVFLSRMEENDYRLEFREFSLSDVLEETCLSYETTAKVRGLVLTLDVQPHVTLNGNEDALRRSIALLMDNAVKYAKSFVNVRLSRTGNAAELRFSNDADNLKRGNLNEFFDRFYRADASRNSATGGHGIGLSVVKSVVAAHKGKITAHSADGNTVEFIITL